MRKFTTCRRIAAAALLVSLPFSIFAEEAPPAPAEVSAAAASLSYPAHWNNNERYPIAYAAEGTAWYEDTKSIKIAANDAEEMIFSIDVFMVHTVSDASAFEFQRFWFRRIRSDDVYTVYVRHGDIGEWTPLSLRETSPEQRLFLAGWQSATGFDYMSV